ncbi:hypothetical protein [Sinorhizobium prairiense]|uniref:hypothetical protein n=1 Tax=unclassified Sinorhizobium TaxID=2613772 RepID=UPI0023D89D78|nr:MULTISPECIES: hypothetical protein [unclassified Sinorhizobium]WEJ11213.1 hypothetical protein N0Q90_08980 [Sinorhizobium sp. M103]WEJ14187.1 hypothetical protein N0Q91_11345 [Sinorhizobium sp. K101]WEJ38197.1 hypothetical protein N0R80_08950 [Sinorhizobium sp. C101]
MPKFAVKSWEDKILGALVRCRRKRIKDHATLKKQGFGLVFFAFSSPLLAKQARENVNNLSVKCAHAPAGLQASRPPVLLRHILGVKER